MERLLSTTFRLFGTIYETMVRRSRYGQEQQTPGAKELSQRLNAFFKILYLQYCRQGNGNYIFAKRVKFSTRDAQWMEEK